MKKIALAAGMAAAFMSTSALAQSIQSGPYAGAQLGWTQNKIREVDTGLGVLGPQGKKDSVIGGAFVGYDEIVGERLLFGAELGISVSSDDEASRTSRGTTLTVDPRYSFDASARAGYLLNDSTLLYARGGYANVRTRATLAGANGTTRGSDNLDGWLVGGGIEKALTDTISARAEYRFSDFSGNYDRHQALLGIALRF